MAAGTPEDKFQKLREENERRRKKKEEDERRRKQEEEQKAKEALERRRQERLEQDERMRKPWQQAPAPKKPILRKGAKQKPVQPASPGVDPVRQSQAEEKRKEWRQGLQDFIKQQRQAATVAKTPTAAAAGPSAGPGQDGAPVVPLTWEELRMAAEAGFDELLRQQELQAEQRSAEEPAARGARYRSPYKSPFKGAPAPPQETVQVALVPTQQYNSLTAAAAAAPAATSPGRPSGTPRTPGSATHHQAANDGPDAIGALRNSYKFSDAPGWVAPPAGSGAGAAAGLAPFHQTRDGAAGAAAASYPYGGQGDTHQQSCEEVGTSGTGIQAAYGDATPAAVLYPPSGEGPGVPGRGSWADGFVGLTGDGHAGAGGTSIGGGGGSISSSGGLRRGVTATARHRAAPLDPASLDMPSTDPWVAAAAANHGPNGGPHVGAVASRSPRGSGQRLPLPGPYDSPSQQEWPPVAQEQPQPSGPNRGMGAGGSAGGGGVTPRKALVIPEDPLEASLLADGTLAALQQANGLRLASPRPTGQPPPPVQQQQLPATFDPHQDQRNHPQYYPQATQQLVSSQSGQQGYSGIEQSGQQGYSGIEQHAPPPQVAHQPPPQLPQQNLLQQQPQQQQTGHLRQDQRQARRGWGVPAQPPPTTMAEQYGTYPADPHAPPWALGSPGSAPPPPLGVSMSTGAGTGAASAAEGPLPLTTVTGTVAFAAANGSTYTPARSPAAVRHSVGVGESGGPEMWQRESVPALTMQPPRPFHHDAPGYGLPYSPPQRQDLGDLAPAPVLTGMTGVDVGTGEGDDVGVGMGASIQAQGPLPPDPRVDLSADLVCFSSPPGPSRVSSDYTPESSPPDPQLLQPQHSQRHRLSGVSHGEMDAAAVVFSAPNGDNAATVKRAAAMEVTAEPAQQRQEGPPSPFAAGPATSTAGASGGGIASVAPFVSGSGSGSGPGTAPGSSLSIEAHVPQAELPQCSTAASPSFMAGAAGEEAAQRTRRVSASAVGSVDAARRPSRKSLSGASLEGTPAGTPPLPPPPPSNAAMQHTHHPQQDPLLPPIARARSPSNAAPRPAHPLTVSVPLPPLVASSHAPPGKEPGSVAAPPAHLQPQPQQQPQPAPGPQQPPIRAPSPPASPPRGTPSQRFHRQHSASVLAASGGGPGVPSAAAPRHVSADGQAADGLTATTATAAATARVSDTQQQPQLRASAPEQSAPTTGAGQMRPREEQEPLLHQHQHHQQQPSPSRPQPPLLPQPLAVVGLVATEAAPATPGSPRVPGIVAATPAPPSRSGPPTLASTPWQQHAEQAPPPPLEPPPRQSPQMGVGRAAEVLLGADTAATSPAPSVCASQQQQQRPSYTESFARGASPTGLRDPAVESQGAAVGAPTRRSTASRSLAYDPAPVVVEEPSEDEEGGAAAVDGGGGAQGSWQRAAGGGLEMGDEILAAMGAADTGEEAEAQFEVEGGDEDGEVQYDAAGDVAYGAYGAGGVGRGGGDDDCGVGVVERQEGDEVEGDAAAESSGRGFDSSLGGPLGTAEGSVLTGSHISARPWSGPSNMGAPSSRPGTAYQASLLDDSVSSFDFRQRSAAASRPVSATASVSCAPASPQQPPSLLYPSHLPPRGEVLAPSGQRMQQQPQLQHQHQVARPAGASAATKTPLPGAGQLGRLPYGAASGSGLTHGPMGCAGGQGHSGHSAPRDSACIAAPNAFQVLQGPVANLYGAGSDDEDDGGGDGRPFVEEPVAGSDEPPPRASTAGGGHGMYDTAAAAAAAAGFSAQAPALVPPGQLGGVEASGGTAEAAAAAAAPPGADLDSLLREIQELSALRKALKAEFEIMGHGEAVAGLRTLPGNFSMPKPTEAEHEAAAAAGGDGGEAATAPAPRALQPPSPLHAQHQQQEVAPLLQWGWAAQQPAAPAAAVLPPGAAAAVAALPHQSAGQQQPENPALMQALLSVPHYVAGAQPMAQPPVHQQQQPLHQPQQVQVQQPQAGPGLQWLAPHPGPPTKAPAAADRNYGSEVPWPGPDSSGPGPSMHAPVGAQALAPGPGISPHVAAWGQGTTAEDPNGRSFAFAAQPPSGVDSLGPLPLPPPVAPAPSPPQQQPAALQWTIPASSGGAGGGTARSPPRDNRTAGGVASAAPPTGPSASSTPRKGAAAAQPKRTQPGGGYAASGALDSPADGSDARGAPRGVTVNLAGSVGTPGRAGAGGGGGGAAAAPAERPLVNEGSYAVAAVQARERAERERAAREALQAEAAAAKAAAVQRSRAERAAAAAATVQSPSAAIGGGGRDAAPLGPKAPSTIGSYVRQPSPVRAPARDATGRGGGGDVGNGMGSTSVTPSTESTPAAAGAKQAWGTPTSSSRPSRIPTPPRVRDAGATHKQPPTAAGTAASTPPPPSGAPARVAGAPPTAAKEDSFDSDLDFLERATTSDTSDTETDSPASYGLSSSQQSTPPAAPRREAFASPSSATAAAAYRERLAEARPQPLRIPSSCAATPMGGASTASTVASRAVPTGGRGSHHHSHRNGGKPNTPFTTAIRELMGLPGSAPLEQSRAASFSQPADPRGQWPGRLTDDEDKLLASLKRLDADILRRGLVAAGLINDPPTDANGRNGAMPGRGPSGAGGKGPAAAKGGRSGASKQNTLTNSLQQDQLRESLERLDVRLGELRRKMEDRACTLGMPSAAATTTATAGARAASSATTKRDATPTRVDDRRGPPATLAKSRTPTPNKAKAIRDQRQQQLSAVQGPSPPPARAATTALAAQPPKPASAPVMATISAATTTAASPSQQQQQQFPSAGGMSTGAGGVVGAQPMGMPPRAPAAKAPASAPSGPVAANAAQQQQMAVPPGVPYGILPGSMTYGLMPNGAVGAGPVPMYGMPQGPQPLPQQLQQQPPQQAQQQQQVAYMPAMLPNGQMAYVPQYVSPGAASGFPGFFPGQQAMGQQMSQGQGAQQQQQQLMHMQVQNAMQMPAGTGFPGGMSHPLQQVGPMLAWGAGPQAAAPPQQAAPGMTYGAAASPSPQQYGGGGGGSVLAGPSLYSFDRMGPTGHGMSGTPYGNNIQEVHGGGGGGGMYGQPPPQPQQQQALPYASGPPPSGPLPHYHSTVMRSRSIGSRDGEAVAAAAAAVTAGLSGAVQQGVHSSQAEGQGQGRTSGSQQYGNDYQQLTGGWQHGRESPSRHPPQQQPQSQSHSVQMQTFGPNGGSSRGVGATGGWGLGSGGGPGGDGAGEADSGVIKAVNLGLLLS